MLRVFGQIFGCFRLFVSLHGGENSCQMTFRRSDPVLMEFATFYLGAGIDNSNTLPRMPKSERVAKNLREKESFLGG